MFTDARGIPSGSVVEADICIVGAGAAGITIAREMAGSGLRVCVLESGGLEFEQETQDLYKGPNVGRPYYDLDICRLRYFGGTTNHWAGWCRPLSPIDFAERAWVPHSGWPFGIEELKPFYRRAYDIVQVKPHDEVEAGFAARAPAKNGLILDESRVVPLTVQFSPPTRFGEVYRAGLAAASNVTVYLHANVVDIETDDAARVVLGLKVATLGGNAFRVAGRTFVLAAGGIENPRLLLLSNKVQTAGLGNDQDLVGRFFMEHPEPSPALFLPRDPGDPLWAMFDQPHREEAGEPLRLMSLHPSIQEREQVLNIAVSLGPGRAEGWDAARRIIQAVKAGRMPDQLASDLYSLVADLDGFANDAYYRVMGGKTHSADVFMIDVYAQQSPNPDSRVMLSSDRDALGLRRVQLDWRLNKLDRHSVRRTLEVLAAELGRLGAGRLKIDFEDWSGDLNPGYHHMGTTRMSENPKRGVVDAACRVHGITNLFVAGSSVFPTTGSAPPTLTIVAMAVRLSDHVKRLHA